MQLNVYPKSTLQDLYKNFFQDKFGPGHLIPDTSAAKAYLERELSEFEISTCPDIEPVGWENNYVRVDLSLLKREIVPERLFFDAFVESANSARMPEIESWKREWKRILKVVEQMAPDLPDFERDKAAIDSLLDAGKYAVHHSSAFEEEYRPHYRIIARRIFDEKLQKYVRR